MKDLTPQESLSLTPLREQAGNMADEILKASVFARYHKKKAFQTLRRQRADLALFMTFLTDLEYPVHKRRAGGISSLLLLAHVTLYWLQVDAMMHEPEAWQGITPGLIELYKEWQLKNGYAIKSVNVRISTVRKYIALATEAGVIPRETLALVRENVKTIQRKEGLHLDKNREVTRIGDKKAVPVVLTSAQVERLLEHPNTPQGSRDAFLMTLLFRYGLRCGEVADLTLANYKRATGKLTFYREKTDGFTTLELEPEDMARAERYYQQCQPENEAINPGKCLIMGSNNRREVFGAMGERAITGRVNTLGKRLLGIAGLSGHDGRHHSASEYVAGGTDAKTLMEIFNWTNTQTAFNYINAAQVANQNAKRGKLE
jgi:integrase